MRFAWICSALAAAATVAAAEPRIVEDVGLGIELAPDRPVISPRTAAAMASCTQAVEPTSGALFWLEWNATGKVVGARVRGSGKPIVDTCLENALRKATPAGKLPGPVAVAGHIDLAKADGTVLPPPRQSKTPVIIAPQGAAWQLTVNVLGYTANRALDIAKSLDETSAAVAACAPKRGATAEPAEAILWYDGAAIVRSGTPAYDTCIGKALGSIKLPLPESAIWAKLAITAPTEPLAPRTDKAALSRAQALEDAITTAVRSRKQQLLACLDNHPSTSLAKVGVTLANGKATITSAVTGNADADACVKKKFGEVAIGPARPDDKLALEVLLERP